MTPDTDALVAERLERPLPHVPDEDERHTIASVLARPRFSFLVVGQTVSQLGDKLHHMALIALVGAGASGATGGIELAKLSVVFTAPVILFGPLAGALVDRWNKRATMIATDAARAVIVGMIPWLFAATGKLWPIYVMAFFVFLLGIFFNSAKMALIPELVPHRQLLAANAALTFIGRFATVGGIVGGGVIIGMPLWRRFGWSDFAAGFYLDSASYVVSVLTLLAVVMGARSRDASGGAATSVEAAARADVPPRAVKRSLGNLVRDVGVTLQVVSRDRDLRFVFASVVLLALFASTVYVAMTYSVQTVMGKGARGVGYLGGILGGGMIVGSLLVGTIGSRWNKRSIIMVCTALIGVVMMLGGILFTFAMFAPVAFVGGMLLAPVMVSQDTLLHECAPADARALIFSTKDLIVGAVFMLSALLVGGGILLFGTIGVDQPYRLALIVIGALITAAGAAGELSVLRRTR